MIQPIERKVEVSSIPPCSRDNDKILCDNNNCPADERGERGRCYTDVYNKCPLYYLKR